MDFSQPFRALTPTLDGPVLRALARSESTMTRPQILSLTGEGSEAGVRKVLSRLVEQGIVIEERIGTHYTYRANRDHILWPAVDIVVTAHNRLDKRIKDRVAEWKIQPLSVELFGSVATGESSSASDIDLMVVIPYLDEGQDEVWDQQVDDLRESVERWTGNVCEILVMDPPQLIEVTASQDPTLSSKRVSLVGARIDAMQPNVELARKISASMPTLNSAKWAAISRATSREMLTPETKRLLEEFAKFSSTNAGWTKRR